MGPFKKDFRGASNLTREYHNQRKRFLSASGIERERKFRRSLQSYVIPDYNWTDNTEVQWAYYVS